MPRHKNTHLPTMGGDVTKNMELTDTALGNLMLFKMKEHKITNLKQLELAMVKQYGDGITHSHLRRMVRGFVVASDHKLQLLAKVLRTPFEEVKEAADLDRLRREFGPTLHKLTKRTPEFEKFEAVLPYLTHGQKDAFYAQMKAMVSQNATKTGKQSKRG